MYLTFEQAFLKINAGTPYSHLKYPYVRISQLIQNGFLEEAYPQLYYKYDGKFYPMAADYLKTRRFVTEESVNTFMTFYQRRGKNVIAKFADGSVKNFASIKEVCEHFKCCREKIKNIIKSNKTVELNDRFVKLSYLK